MTRCRDCRADIRWTLTFTGRRLAVDPVPPVDGSGTVVAALNDGGAWPKGRVVGPVELSEMDGPVRAGLLSRHDATCQGDGL